MKEQEFEKELEEWGYTDGINIMVYYTIDEKGNVVLDEESIKEELEIKLKELKEILE
jgi:hypothetical protein